MKNSLFRFSRVRAQGTSFNEFSRTTTILQNSRRNISSIEYKIEQSVGRTAAKSFVASMELDSKVIDTPLVSLSGEIIYLSSLY